MPSSPALQPATHPPTLSPWHCFLVLLLVAGLFHSQAQTAHGLALAALAVGDAAILTAILYACCRLDIARLSLAFLALPYPLFLLGWLQLAAGGLVLALFLASLLPALRHTQGPAPVTVDSRVLAGFLVLMAWVNLSGAGGYGAQTLDYALHNSRLADLVNHDWPVRYGENQNLVYYTGYFLPAAALGKLAGLEWATRSLQPWTLFGVMLAMRWLSHFSRWKTGAGLVLLFILYGPPDLFGCLWLWAKALLWPLSEPQHPISLLATYHASMSVSDYLLAIRNTDTLSFWAGNYLQTFTGNMLSNTFQLFWSPQQVVAAWVGIALLTHLFLSGQGRYLLFAFALLSLWCPLVMLAISGLVLLAAVACYRQRHLLSLANTAGAGSLLALFLCYYSGGSALENPAGWTFSLTQLAQQGDIVLASYLFSWGLPVVVAAPLLAALDSREKSWALGLLATLALLPLVRYGAFNDLLCRGSAATQFVLLAGVLRYLGSPTASPARKALLGCAMLAGSLSALLLLHTAVVDYGKTQAAQPVTSYQYAAENLGDDQSWFARYLRKAPDR